MYLFSYPSFWGTLTRDMAQRGGVGGEGEGGPGGGGGGGGGGRGRPAGVAGLSPGGAGGAGEQQLENLNIVIVTHGLTLRLLLMRYFQMRVVQFEGSSNPGNAELVVMSRCNGKAEADEEGGEWARRMVEEWDDNGGHLGNKFQRGTREVETD